MYRKPDDQTRRDPFQDVTDRILAALEAGTKPWVKPWDPAQAAGPQAPFNPTTGRYYRGINVLLLGMDMRAFISSDPRWMTYQQVFGGDSFRLGVDGREALELGRRLREIRHHSPSHHHQFTVAGVAALPDDRLKRRRRDVEIRRQLEVIRQLAEVEGFGDALFVGTAIVTATHTRNPKPIRNRGKAGRVPFGPGSSRKRSPRQAVAAIR